MNYEFLKSLDLDYEVINKLSSQLSRVELGNSEVIISPLGKNLDPELILFAWDSILQQNKARLNKDLMELELLNRDKFGPRSVAADWVTRKESVLTYFGQDKVKAIPKHSDFQPRSLRPISLQNAIGFLKNGTNSGLPFYRRKGDVKDILEREFTELLDRRDPCIMFTRTQESGKTRTVWGYPCADTLNEMMFYRPLLQYQRNMPWRSALLGPEAVNHSMTGFIKMADDLDRYLLSIDFELYDASLKEQLQKVSYDYIRGKFQTEYHTALYYQEERMNTIGLVTPDGILQGNHGMPSGSTYTNEVDSIAQYECATSLGVSDDQLDVQGDDGTYVLTQPDILKEGFNDFGLRVNEEKSYIRKDSIVYLQNLYSLDYMQSDGIIRGIYPTYRALSKIIYPERFDRFSVDSLTGADYYSIRTISILENCREHPLFVDLVKFVAKLDRYKLGYSQIGLQKYIQRIKKSSGSEGLLSHKPEHRVSGINTFATVKVLAEL